MKHLFGNGRVPGQKNPFLEVHTLQRVECCFGGAGTRGKRKISANGMVSKASNLIKKGRAEEARGWLNGALERGLDGKMQLQAYFLLGVSEYVEARLANMFGSPAEGAYSKAKEWLSKAGDSHAKAAAYLELIKFHEKYKSFRDEIFKETPLIYNLTNSFYADKMEEVYANAGLEKGTPFASMCVAQHCFCLAQSLNGNDMEQDAPRILREAARKCSGKQLSLLHAEALFMLVVLEKKDEDIVGLLKQSPYHRALLMKRTGILIGC